MLWCVFGASWMPVFSFASSFAMNWQMTIMYVASPHKLNNLKQAKLFLTRVNKCVGVSMHTPRLSPSYDHVAFRMMPLWSLSLHRSVIGLNCLSDQGCPHVPDKNRPQYELENPIFFLCVCQKKNPFNTDEPFNDIYECATNSIPWCTCLVFLLLSIHQGSWCIFGAQ